MEASVGFAAILRHLTGRREAAKAALECERQLDLARSELSVAVERERRRISRELHDRVGHLLAIARLELHQVGASPNRERSIRAAERTDVLLRRALEETRSLTVEIGSPVLWELGLKAGLRSLARQILETRGVAVELAIEADLSDLEERVQVTLYRAIEELFVNTVKHARARRLRLVAIECEEWLVFALDDDGVGFDAHVLAGRQVGRRMGLLNVRERLGHLGGRLRVDSSPGRGTRAYLTLPRRRSSGDDA